MLEANFWHDKNNSQRVIKEKKIYEDLIRSFEDSDRNWLGDTLNDPARGFTSSFTRTDTKDSNGNVTGFIEQGSNKQVDPVTGDTIFERSFSYTFNNNYELIEAC